MWRLLMSIYLSPIGTARRWRRARPRRSTATAAGTTAGRGGSRYASGMGWRGACRARARAETTPGPRASSACSSRSSSIRATGGASAWPNSCPSSTPGCGGSARAAYPRRSAGSRPTSTASRRDMPCRYKKKSAVPFLRSPCENSRWQLLRNKHPAARGDTVGNDTDRQPSRGRSWQSAQTLTINRST